MNNQDWSNAYPDFPGYYWIRVAGDEQDDNPVIVELIQRGSGELRALMMGEDMWMSLDNLNVDWKGPIMPGEIRQRSVN